MNPDDFKKFNIGSIIRATESFAALKHQLGFLIKVLQELEIKFSDCEQDPLRLAKAYVAGEIPIERCKAQAAVWWAKIDEQGAVRELRDREVLKARLAICLLANDEDDLSVLGDNLSWFLEVLGFLNVEPMKPIAMMREYFEFK
ncbi:hypothetical protein [Pseudomonas protegens]|uniref:hypothetical protein n=1 Tax=Pseudomonas protegens TaxID=380021 RepID=UPI001472CCBE|nr:hypothetical protein [Pseudomonas protegens]NMZ31867.1 hypothetical protein [Pseudomonas protegens]NMZ87517.1 hypothetical protein [Pseudomonas protegens]